MSTLVLDWELNYDFKLLAIRTSVESSKLCYFINKVLELQLGRMDEDLDFYFKKRKKEALFPSFSYRQTDDFPTWYLIQNIIENELYVEYDQENEPLFKDLKDDVESDYLYLVPELDGVAFFLLIYPPFTGIRTQEIINTLDELPFIDAVFEKSPNQLKDIENLLIH
ncbi:MAG: IPExxxVDY family protein [Flavobacteriales bacterium]|jgi:hypothetical protein|nr:IPExxxVDY family protein [Flavobacteriales bacterium]